MENQKFSTDFKAHPKRSPWNLADSPCHTILGRHLTYAGQAISVYLRGRLGSTDGILAPFTKLYQRTLNIKVTPIGRIYLLRKELQNTVPGYCQLFQPDSLWYRGNCLWTVSNYNPF